MFKPHAPPSINELSLTWNLPSCTANQPRQAVMRLSRGGIPSSHVEHDLPLGLISATLLSYRLSVDPSKSQEISLSISVCRICMYRELSTCAKSSSATNPASDYQTQVPAGQAALLIGRVVIRVASGRPVRRRCLNGCIRAVWLYVE